MTFDSLAADFWNKEEPRVMGDIRSRPNVVRLLGDIKGKKVLDAGCGTGYMSRMLAKTGAQVYGIDESREMLDKANSQKTKVNDWLDFRQESVHSTGFDLNFFDSAIMVGVLMYNQNPGSAIAEMHRVLRPEGKLVLSVTHPFLYEKNSPALTERPYWLELDKTTKTARNGSCAFNQLYKDKDGKIFSAEVYDHSLPLYFNELSRNGFRIEEVNQQRILSQHDFLHESWGSFKYDYPSYLQILARKEK